MSTHRVEITTLETISDHPNADRLDIALVGDTDWQVVIGKGNFERGDTCIYIPIDSLLPEDLETHLFPPDSKITLDKHRVRSIKIRGAMSQGMVINPRDLFGLFPGLQDYSIGDDVADFLGVTKYEPPTSAFQGQSTKHRQARKGNPDFLKYTDIENYKYYPRIFEDDEEVYITEKIHGTSVRYALLPTAVNSFWRRIKKFLHLLPQYEFCYGSRNVQLQFDKGKLFYDNDVYAEIAKRLGIEDILLPGEALYGEIVGSGIQKGYTYGCSEGELDFYAYDVKVDGRYLDMPAFIRWVGKHGIKRVPLIYTGKMEFCNLDNARSGPSTIRDIHTNKAVQDVREGVVIKPVVETLCFMGRKVLKLMNDDYLLDKENTDHH